MRIFQLLVLLIIVSSCQEPTKSTDEVQEKVVLLNKALDPIFHTSHEPKKATAPFSDAVQVGNLFFLGR